MKAGSLLAGLPAAPLAKEITDILADAREVRIERIVSTGQVTPEGQWYDQETPEGQWYDQETDEWVSVAAGAARLRIEGEEADRELTEGDWVLVPARCRHRVTWTKPSRRQSGSPCVFERSPRTPKAAQPGRR